MNENMHSYKSNLIIKSIYEISQKLGNIYPIPKKYKINKSLKEKKIIIIVCITILTILLMIILKICLKNK